MADFQLKVVAETQRAEKDLQRLDKTASDATRERKLKIDIGELNKNFKDVQGNIKEAANTIQTFYKVSKNIPGIGDRVKEFESLAKGTVELAKNAPASAAALRENAKAGSVLAGSLETAGSAAGRLINNLAKAGFALFAVKEAVGVLQSAFGGFFNETIGREIKLRETILKTQTTLASTNKVFRNGAEITDPYQKIVALTGEIAKRIDSIRERSIALAGVTSNDVIEVFGIVASQVGQIGGGLKEAEDLAINFSAALGTFGIPLYQARQEIGSILRGDITMDSYLAKALGITNEDIAKAKTEAGGVIKFLEERLAASVAGQRIAAQGFSGVVSNIRDLGELISQRFGAGLLDPLLGGLTKVFDFLFKIREEVFSISEGIGRGLGSLLSTNATLIGGGSALFTQVGAGAEDFAAQLAKEVKTAFASLQTDANAFIAPLRNLLEELTKSFGLVSAGLARLAQGFISIKIENFKALVQIFSNLSEAVTTFSAALGQILRAYGQLLQVPFVQYLSQVSAQFQLLEKLGVMSAVKLGFAATALIVSWTPIVTFFQGLVARIATLLGGLVIAIGAAFTRLGAVVAAFAGTLTATYPAVEALKQQLLGLATSLTTAGVAADKAGVSVTRFGGATAGAARAVGGAILSFVKFNAILLAVQVAIAFLIDQFGRYQRRQEEAARSTRAAEALRLLQTKYKDVGDAADSATKAARDFNQALVDAQYTRNLDALEEVREKLNQIRYELKPGIQSWGEFWDAASGRESGRFEQGRREEMQRLLQEEARIKGQLSEVDRARDKKSAEENIQLEANNRKNMEQEIKDIRLRQENELFSKRQELAQKEVDIFRAAGELRIFQMEQANKKMMEGQEGASAAAMDALNTYLSARERGELEIEAAKKQLVIEVANMEREIENYKLENAKTIAKIRKESAQYEQRVAENNQVIARNGAASAGGVTGLYQGNTGTSTSGPHFHVSGAGSEAEARSLFAADVNSKLTLTDVPGSRRGGGRRHQGYDLAGPAGTPLNLASGFSLQNFTSDPGGLGGNYATIAGPNGKSYKVMHLANPGSSYKGPTKAVAPPQAPNFDAIGTPAVDKYAAAVRNVSSAMERLRALQAALTEAKTKAAFEEIAKAAFPRAQVEQYKDQLIEAQLSLKAFASSKSDAYDPDRAAIEVRYQKELLIMDRERKEIQEAAAKAEGVKKAELVELEKKITEQIEKRKKDLTEIKNLEGQILAITRAQTVIESLRKSFKDNTKDIRNQQNDLMVGTRMQLEGFSPEQIDTQMKVIAAAREYDAKNTEIQKDIAVAEDAIATKRAAGTAVTAQEIQTLNNLKKSLEDARVEYNSNILAIQGFAAAQQAAKTALAWQVDNRWESAWGGMKQGLEEYAASLGTLKSQMQDFTKNTLGAMSNAFVELLTTGTTNFRQLAANILTDLTRIIFQTMVLKPLLKALASPLGGGSMFGFASGGIMTSNGPLPLRSYAGGGIANSPQVALFGEGSKPEAFVPLPDGKSIPVSFDRSGATSSGNVSVNVNVDAKGTQAQGDSKKSEQIGKVIASAVQEEILRMKRPGGLLAS